jgi:hypothetical protein
MWVLLTYVIPLRKSWDGVMVGRNERREGKTEENRRKGVRKEGGKKERKKRYLTIDRGIGRSKEKKIEKRGKDK